MSKVKIHRVSIEDIELDDIYQFMSQEQTNGSALDGSDKIMRYLDLMDKVRSMNHRINVYGNKESIIKHLMLHEDLSRYHANRLYENALEYFYSSSEISKDAWRNILAEKIMQQINFSIQIQENVADAKSIANMILNLHKVLNLDVVDPPEIPENTKPFKVLSFNPTDFDGFEAVDRKKLAKFIDQLELTEPEKLKIKRDALIEKPEISFIKEKDGKTI